MDVLHKLVDNRIRISVRNLVEFVLQSGSIDNRRSTKVQHDAMLIGGRLHRKIQGKMGANYQAEVVLKHSVFLDGIELALEGRADGILTEEGHVTIDEIKILFMTAAELSHIEEPYAVHTAQAVCYGYIYAVQKELPGVTIQLTYCEPETEMVRRFQEEYSMDRLKEEFDSYIREYAKWARFVYEHRTERNASIEGLQFPYPYREGQRRLVVASYRAIMAKNELFIQASTGIGKTLSVLFPAVVAIGQGTVEKIFYLTAKTITRSVAQEGLRILRGKGLCLSSVTITAKEKFCFQETMDCNPVACPYADGHFDRVNSAVYDLITHEKTADRETILDYAKRYRVCPFEMCLDVTYWVDAIICDYNYVFDPNVRLQRFFAEEEQGDYVFLVDEAHNLVDRAREMYSASLCKEDILEAKKLYKEFPHILKKLESCNRKLLELKRECDSWKLLPDGEGMGPLLLSLEQLYNELMLLPEKYPQWTGNRQTSEFFFQVRDFLTVNEVIDENYRIYAEHTEDGSFWLHQLCVNPAKRLQECCAQGISTIFFSATLLPILYYKELLFGRQDAAAVYAKSPFDPALRYLGIGTDVTTRYTRRSRTEYERYGLYIEQALRARRGNYLIFFPSYRYLEDVRDTIRFPEEYQVLTQEGNMTETDKEAFLEAFSKNDRPTVGLCVMGGIFSEGIDLQRESLVGVLIAGTGLPQVNPRQEILRQFYEEQGKDGYAFAYLYPGMNKVLQAAGRLIRTFEDYGIILLLDERFLRREYQSLFPVEWDSWQIINSRDCGRFLEDFWSRINAQRFRDVKISEADPKLTSGFAGES